MSPKNKNLSPLKQPTVSAVRLLEVKVAVSDSELEVSVSEVGELVSLKVCISEVDELELLVASSIVELPLARSMLAVDASVGDAKTEVDKSVLVVVRSSTSVLE